VRSVCQRLDAGQAGRFAFVGQGASDLSQLLQGVDDRATQLRLLHGWRTACKSRCKEPNQNPYKQADCGAPFALFKGLREPCIGGSQRRDFVPSPPAHKNLFVGRLVQVSFRWFP
jgi:hypothetical protein